MSTFEKNWNLAVSDQDFEDAQSDLANAVAALDEVSGEYEDAKLQFDIESG